ncbi:heavy metal-responsive transcriptional regulator [Halobacteriovorax sp. GB3]|uniref:heavy metal-responsive transcriptional regulator n=1 Tax=Halobacteriovorax sp. GB3 TaxID=2719615 RepID=UPI00235FE633|nr:heavy metal-responsive transcriptional regulator [Halobacteriovorax sp. GB3]
MSMTQPLTIGKLADASNVNVETIRFYERKGLLKRPTTKAGAFRVYPNQYISKISFIKKAQELGFTLAEIKDLLLLDQNTSATCAHVSKKANKKLLEVKEKIESLKKMKKSLEKIIHACDAGPDIKACCRVSDCFDSKC